MVGALSASLEDYLEAIFHITSERKVARARDIARRLRVGNSSVTGALRALAEKGLIQYAPYDFVTLTEEGDRMARDISRRHRLLQDFLVRVLGVDPEVSDAEACKMEHALSKAVSERLIQFVRFIERCPRCGESWVSRFSECRGGVLEPKRCAACVRACVEEATGRAEGTGDDGHGDR